MYEVSTDKLQQKIKSTVNIKDYFKNNCEHMIRQSLSEHLNALLIEKNIIKADVVRNSLLDKGYVYQIFSGEKTPSRDKLIAIAFGLSLSLEETQKMLKLSGNRELYARDERDALIFFSMEKNKNIEETNNLLHSYEFESLGVTSNSL